ncbi:MAG TPA: YidC/Oxa1 family membrane protein insertase [Candidatus Nitrosotalea sp.]|nr:YidC/Oxa1 family membrane protein insertase [Candidatus Nitrosotalea sp.]
MHDVWWAIFGQTISWGLTHVYDAVSSVPALAAVGAYGLAIVIVTLMIRLILSPLYQFQLRISRRSMQEQRKVAPQVAELKKKYKGDSQKQQQAMMELYKEHGINPLGGLMGCLPALLQFPVLTALYWVFLGNAHANRFSDHFLFVPHLNDLPSHHPMLHGLPIPDLTYLIIPLLAAATTFVQSRMMQQPPNPLATDQEQQTQQMTRQMQVIMPLVIGYFAILTPAGLGLYWFVSNCFAIIQQYLVTGWGGFRPAPVVAAAITSKPASNPIPAKKRRKPTR